MSSDKKKPAEKKVADALPKHDANNPLIVDLPDGQKLVIGELADGSIIEIATWRGTGRPDSRTSRLMLGMANGRAEQVGGSNVQESSQGEAKSSEDFLSQIKGSFAGLTSRFTTSKEKKSPAVEASNEIDEDNSAEVKEGKKSSSTENVNHIKSAGSSFISRIREQSQPQLQSLESEIDSGADELDQWLANILDKAEKSVARKDARKKAAKKKSSTAKKATPAKKAAKSAQSSKRVKKAAPSSSSSKKR